MQSKLYVAYLWVNKTKEQDNYYEKSEVVRLGRGWYEQHQQIDNNCLII
jgi:hypothetical protein